MISLRKELEKKRKRIVIKIGTSSITSDNGINKDILQRLCKTIAELRKDNDVVLVTSGAVGMGKQEVLSGLYDVPKDLLCKCEKEINGEEIEFTSIDKQLLSGAGQDTLMAEYKQEFRKYRVLSMQNLIAGCRDYEGIKEVLEESFKAKNKAIMGVVNANDTVYDKELRIGDNDTLSANVARVINADMLVLITDIDGLHRKDEKGNMLELVESIDVEDIDYMRQFAGDTESKKGTGGMLSKLDAGEIASNAGVDTYIIQNTKIEDIAGLVDGTKQFGTRINKSITKQLNIDFYDKNLFYGGLGI